MNTQGGQNKSSTAVMSARKIQTKDKKAYASSTATNFGLTSPAPLAKLHVHATGLKQETSHTLSPLLGDTKESLNCNEFSSGSAIVNSKKNVMSQKHVNFSSAVQKINITPTEGLTNLPRSHRDAIPLNSFKVSQDLL
jgi:hypothetical protein